MKTLLIGVNARYSHANPAIRLLHQVCDGMETEIYEAGLKDRPFDVLADLIDRDAQVYAFSTYIWNIEIIRHLAELLRKARPDAVILYGGPEAGADPEEEFKLSPQTDLIVSGEAEEIFPELLRRIEVNLKDGREAVVKSLRENPIQGVNLPGGPVTMAKPVDVNRLPATSAELIEDLPHRIVYVEGQRGCPYSCAYCMSGQRGTLRLKEPKVIVEEVLALSRAGAKLIKFVDRTFNANAAFARQVLEGIMAADREEKLETRFHFEISADILTEELMDIFIKARPGLFQIEAGMQSTDGEVLARVSRTQNVDRILSNTRRIREAGRTHMHLDLILGLPAGNLETFIRSFNACMQVYPEMLQLGFLKVLRGSPLRDRAEAEGLIYDDRAPYEVICTPGFTAAELSFLRRFETLFDHYYNSGRFTYAVRSFLEAGTETAYDFFYGLYEDLDRKDLIGVKKNPKEEARLFTQYLIGKVSDLPEAQARQILTTLAADLTIAGFTPEESLIKEISEDFSLEDSEILEILQKDNVRELISREFPQIRLRSPKYLMRDVRLFRAELEPESGEKLYITASGKILPLSV